jgi:hypothetical protein
MPENYIETEKRIAEATNAYNRDKKRKISALAEEFDVPYRRLWAESRVGDQNQLAQPPTKPLTRIKRELFCSG